MFRILTATLTPYLILTFCTSKYSVLKTNRKHCSAENGPFCFLKIFLPHSDVMLQKCIDESRRLRSRNAIWSKSIYGRQKTNLILYIYKQNFFLHYVRLSFIQKKNFSSLHHELLSNLFKYRKY